MKRQLEDEALIKQVDAKLPHLVRVHCGDFVEVWERTVGISLRLSISLTKLKRASENTLVSVRFKVKE